jgi:hypothetical protein
MAAGGHTAAAAERQAARLLAFTAADPVHLDLFAHFSARMREETQQVNKSDWTKKMAQAARAWSASRPPEVPCERHGRMIVREFLDVNHAYL